MPARERLCYPRQIMVDRVLDVIIIEARPHDATRAGKDTAVHRARFV